MKTNSFHQNSLNSTTEFESVKIRLKEKIQQLLNRIKLTEKSNILRIEEQLLDVDPLKWLRQQKNPIKIYWSDRDRQYEFAGIGCAHMISDDSEIDYKSIFKEMENTLNPQYENMRYFGGFSFDTKKQDAVWQNFGAYNFNIPKVEVSRKGKDIKIAVNYKSTHIENIDLYYLDSINYNSDFNFKELPIYHRREDNPSKSEWIENIKLVKQLFRDREIKKIVLARISRLEFSDELIPEDLLYHLKETSNRSFHFYFQTKPNLAFLGASPELLYRRESSQIFSEAVAGTRSRGITKEEDKKLANDLLNSEKDIHEHDLVCQSIASGMNQLCDSVEIDNNVSILKSENVQHLYKKFRGILKRRIGDADIISKLHPTPAVGGVPKEIALQEIRKIESFNRGWYAGPVGWIGSNNAKFAVGIRSALVSGKQLYFFSGAGTVPDSDPEQEWQEIEHKIGHFTKVFKE